MTELIHSETQSLLVRTYLEGFRRRPELPTPYASTWSAERATGPSGSLPSTVARAVDFIDGHARDPIGLAEIAAAARLSPRALQAGFRRYLTSTPLGYLRHERLARVHAALTAARPGDGQTVSTIASTWGFDQLSRFARDYKKRYGVSPRQTLRRQKS